jgi:hypothetical protein
MELNWSRWFRCESSFGLFLVPNKPGIFALAEEVGKASRMLAVFEISEAGDVAHALSWLFAPASPWYERMVEGRCYIRYAIVPDASQRRAAAVTLKNWLNSQMDAGGQVFEQKRVPATEITVAEQAVDRVMKKTELAKPAVPAGF